MIIDLHAHFVAPDLIDEVRRNGAAYGVELAATGNDQQALAFRHSGMRLRPFFSALCSLPARLDYLAAAGVDRQVISAWTDMGGDDLPLRQGQLWARLQNETLADTARRSDGRLVAMGTLPMQTADAAIGELDHIVDKLGIRSIQLGSSVEGRDLDHSDYRPLWRRIAELGVLVLLHPPHRPVGIERLGDYFLNNLIGFPTDTTIAAARLMFSGILSDLPELKICLAHAGGFLPYQIGRLDRGYAAHPACQKISQPPSELLKSFYFDTLTHSDDVLAFLCRSVGPERVMYGSDYPFEMLDAQGPQRLRTAASLTAAERSAVLGVTAAALLDGQPARHAAMTG